MNNNKATICIQQHPQCLRGDGEENIAILSIQGTFQHIFGKIFLTLPPYIKCTNTQKAFLIGPFYVPRNNGLKWVEENATFISPVRGRHDDSETEKPGGLSHEWNIYCSFSIYYVFHSYCSSLKA